MFHWRHYVAIHSIGRWSVSHLDDFLHVQVPRRRRGPIPVRHHRVQRKVRGRREMQRRVLVVCQRWSCPGPSWRRVASRRHHSLCSRSIRPAHPVTDLRCNWNKTTLAFMANHRAWRSLPHHVADESLPLHCHELQLCQNWSKFSAENIFNKIISVVPTDCRERAVDHWRIWSLQIMAWISIWISLFLAQRQWKRNEQGIRQRRIHHSFESISADWLWSLCDSPFATRQQTLRCSRKKRNVDLK